MASLWDGHKLTAAEEAEKQRFLTDIWEHKLAAVDSNGKKVKWAAGDILVGARKFSLLAMLRKK